MKLVVFVQNQGQITLNDSNYVAAGGEASIYKIGKTAYKIYHDAAKMIPLAKIDELNKIQASNVLRPQDIIRNKNKPIGYTMDFITNTHPMCKLFTKSFKEMNKLSNDDMIKIIKEIQLTLRGIHKENCLVVDLNELNLLCSDNFKKVYFIDTDSFQTPSCPATAIMDSIKDRLIKNNQWNVYSDWFSFAVIAFQLYVGIHPYKGSHPSYKPNEWSKRMDDGISVFDKKVSLPKVCNDFSVIPDNHLKWMKNVFLNNERSIPPLPDEVIIVVPVIQKVVSTDLKDFDIKLLFECMENIQSIFSIGGVKYIVTNKMIYKEDKEIYKADNGKFFICESGDVTSPVICRYNNSQMEFFKVNGECIGSVSATDVMCKNNCIYCIYNGKMIEYSFQDYGSKILTKTKCVCNVSELSTKMFDGVVFQDLLGKIHISLPYEHGKCLFIHVPELDGHRVLEAKADGKVCVVIAEKKGIYYRFILWFNDKYDKYTIRKEDNVSYAPVNFAIKPNGVCIMHCDNGLEIFLDNNVRIISNSPIEDNMILISINGEICFIDENRVCSLKSK